jgi:hypothetical protein
MFRQNRDTMWTCPKCGESIEDQIDSCWKCVGAAQTATRGQNFWMCPVISLVSLAALFQLGSMFYHSSARHYTGGHFTLGGAMLGVVASWVCIRAFLRCPFRHWVAKILTLVFLMGVLWIGVVMAESFLIHALGYDYGWEGGDIWPIERWPFLGLLCVYALSVWTVRELALELWRVLAKSRLMKPRRA